MSNGLNTRELGPAPSLTQSYRYANAAHNEMLSGPTQLRPHWRYLAQSLDTVGAAELQRRVAEARRLIRDNDVTYNVYSDPRGMGRPWELDLVPLLIESDEWQHIEEGLIQRAELLNLLLKDVYGERNVIKKGIVPPQALFSHPGFLFPCDGVRRPDDRYLDIYAADLARGPDGQFQVIGDRTQAPSGAGYALENRVVLSQVLPSLFRDSHVHRLASFFRALRARMSALAGPDRDDPNIVILTPGASNETHFEHAYLANYLGYTLVQGTDLVSSDGRIWLRTLNGMQPVDVIVRRVDDEYCDPLELREDSFLGVPGMLQAARYGAVAVANPLGSGVLQNPALAAFMPALARYFLSQDLQLPMADSWWCGIAQHCDHVLTHLNQMVVKPLQPTPLGSRTLVCKELNQQQQTLLRALIKAKPHLFAAQERITLSTAPVFSAEGSLEPRSLVLRSFLAAEEDSYKVMPGGLARVSATPDDYMVSSQAGGISKDAWVIASEPEKQETLLPLQGYVPPVVSDIELPSRVADNMFWAGRYAERAEATARLLRGIQRHRAEQLSVIGFGEQSDSLRCLLHTLTVQTGTFPGFADSDSQQQLRQPDPELVAILTDANRYGSLSQSVHALLRTMRSLRDRLSSDHWPLVNAIDEELQRLSFGNLTALSEALDALDRLIAALAGLSGLIGENMRRGQGWRFLDCGRRLERALHTATLLESLIEPPDEHADEAALMETLLNITDSLLSYRRRYGFNVQADATLELLLQDETHPRAITYQLMAMQEHVHRLRDPGRRHRLSPEERVSIEMFSDIRLADVSALCAIPGIAARREQLATLLTTLKQRLQALSDAITAAYFRHEEQMHQLIPARQDDTP